MNDSQEFKLPDVGEGLTEAEITTWHVAVGDTVAVNDIVVDIETAKSVVELPSPFSGVVERLLVAEGETVPVGTPLIVIGAGAQAGDPAVAAASEDSDHPETEADSGSQVADDPEAEKPQVLVGPGPKEAAARRRRLGSTQPAAAVAPPGSPEPLPVGNRARATPPVRLLAKRLGVDLEALAVTADPIRAEDVERAAGHAPEAAGPPAPASETAASEMSASETAGLRETRAPVRGVRKVTADAMVRSAFTAPHVTEWLAVDMTRTLELVARLKKDRAWSGVRVNPLLMVARSFVLAVRSYPEINASWDDAAGEIVYKSYVNLGIAAATPRGLLVPNIKDAHTLDLRGLAASLETLIETARAGKTQPADMSGGTVTITNIGALGVDAGTPILNPGESAILAFGAIRPQPWVVDGEIRVRQIAQLALSFDHRLVDGELGSNVLARTGELLADPGHALLYV